MSGDARLASENAGGNDVSESFAKLRTAVRFEGLPRGGVGQRFENYAAFAEARRAGSGSRAEIETILRSATPAGRIYAALLLREIDEEAGRRALEELRADESALEATWDCSPEPYTVGRLAAEALSGKVVVEITPPLRGTVV